MEDLRNLFTNTFLNGTVLYVNYENGCFCVYTKDRSDSVSPTSKYETFDKLIDGLIPIAEANAEEEEELNTLAVGLYFTYKDWHQYKTMDDLIEKFTSVIVLPSAFDDDESDRNICFIDSEAEYIFHFIYNKLYDSQSEIQEILEYMQDNDYCKERSLVNDWQPLATELDEIRDRLYGIYCKLIDIYESKGLMSTHDLEK